MGFFDFFKKEQKKEEFDIEDLPSGEAQNNKNRPLDQNDKCLKIERELTGKN